MPTIYSHAKVYGDPGKAYIAYKYRHNSKPITHVSQITDCTYHTACYKALQKALEYAAKKGPMALDIYCTSRLVLKQVAGEWAPRTHHESEMVRETRYWLNLFDKATLLWVDEQINEAAALLVELNDHKTVETIAVITNENPKSYVEISSQIE